jgi:hypothetical protein
LFICMYLFDYFEWSSSSCSSKRQHIGLIRWNAAPVSGAAWNNVSSVVWWIPFSHGHFLFYPSLTKRLKQNKEPKAVKVPHLWTILKKTKMYILSGFVLFLCCLLYKKTQPDLLLFDYRFCFIYAPSYLRPSVPSVRGSFCSRKSSETVFWVC